MYINTTIVFLRQDCCGLLSILLKATNFKTFELSVGAILLTQPCNKEFDRNGCRKMESKRKMSYKSQAKVLDNGRTNIKIVAIHYRVACLFIKKNFID